MADFSGWRKIGVVRIGESDLAPNFKLIVEPNDWEKEVKAATGAGPQTEKSKLYWDFWEQFRTRVVAEHPGWTNRKTSTRDSWYDLSTGVGGILYETAFTQQGLRVALNFASPDAALNLARFQALHALKDQFESALGETAQWDDKPGRKSAVVVTTSTFNDVTEEDEWAAGWTG